MRSKTEGRGGVKEYSVTRSTEERALSAALIAAKLAKLIGPREVFGEGRVPARLGLAEMRALAREARRLAGELTLLAVHVERTIGERA